MGVVFVSMFPNESQYDEIIRRVRTEFRQVPAQVIKAVIATESGFRERAYLEEQGGDGSIGLMQIRLSTARELGFLGPKEQLYEPYVNIYYGTKYLAQLQERVPDRSWSSAVSAYNGGIRPHLGFGAPVTRNTTVCLRRDPATGRCVRTFQAKPGEYGNQPHVDRWRRFLEYFGGGKLPETKAMGVLPLLGIAVGALILGSQRGAP